MRRTTLNETIASLVELGQQRGGKTKRKVTLYADEIWSIIQDLGMEYNNYEAPKKTVCSTTSNRKLDVAMYVVQTLRGCDPLCSARILHYYCCCQSKSGR